MSPPTTTGSTTRGTTPSNGAPVATAFADTIGNAASRIRARKASSETSNSWLPSAARSTPTALSTSTICRPASRSPSMRAVPSADGLRKSPAKTVIVFGVLGQQPLAEPGDARQPAGLPALDGRDLVDVVEVEDGKGHRRTGLG